MRPTERVKVGPGRHAPIRYITQLAAEVQFE